ncbi:hypothetical protein ACGFIG_26455 [Micromonospora sp. NPDC049048]|uniref:hypothetical protein n=1 Tax=Micromonospora sp. NPDC049048 TaxID=3364263 RepID=UPI00372016DA
MPQFAFANTFWQRFDVIEKSVKAGVRKAMERFQQITIAELHAEKGLHLASMNNARDPGWTIRRRTGDPSTERPERGSVSAARAWER